MTICEQDNICVFPLNFDLLIKKERKIFDVQSIDESNIAEIVTSINSMSPDKIYAIDMQFINVVGDAGAPTFGKLKELIAKYRIAIINIQEYTGVLDLLKKEVGVPDSNIFYYDIRTLKEHTKPMDNRYYRNAVVLLGECPDFINIKSTLEMSANCYKQYVARLVKQHCIDDTTQYLPSSDVYSSKYIAFKSFFLHPKELSFCIYLLCKLIKDYYSDTRIDALVSMSSTGSVLATLVGKMLGKDVLFCTNIGPQFALDLTYIKNNIKQANNYLCIFDFICLGTEFKILKSIVTCFEAHFLGGVGIASYPNITSLRESEDSQQESNSPLIKAYPLFDLKSVNIDYSISINKKSLS